MIAYFKSIGQSMKDWKNAVLVVVLTLARLIFGWAWIEAGWEKLGWFTSAKPNSAGLIGGMINNLAGPQVQHGDPLGLNILFAWAAQNIFLTMPRVTDYLVVICELGIGVLLILGVRIFWTALVAIFLNLQYMAAGSFNNFGYLWTDLAFLKFSKAAEAVGIDGYLRSRKGKDIL